MVFAQTAKHAPATGRRPSKRVGRKESGRVHSAERRIAQADGADVPKRYGIGVEFVPARGGNIIRRMVDEAKAGVQYFDVHIGGTESIITGLLPENVLEPVEPFFVLPEVRDPKQWWAGHIWADNAKRFVYAFVAYQTVSLWK